MGDYTQEYAFTITLQPKLHKHSIRHQLDCTAYSILPLFPHCLITIVVELTKQYNVHYHGIIQFYKPLLKGKTPLSYWYNKLRNHATIGFTCLKVIDDIENWKKYITKDIITTKEELNNTIYKNVILRDQHQIETIS